MERFGQGDQKKHEKKEKNAAKQKRQVRVCWDEGCMGFVWEVASGNFENRVS